MAAKSLMQKPSPSRLGSHHSVLCTTHIEVEAHVLIAMASPLQSHKVMQQRKLQERQGDLQSKHQLLAVMEKVGAVLITGRCTQLKVPALTAQLAACGLST